MANIDDAFRVEKLSLDDGVLITQGSADPTTGPGYEAPVGSLYLRTNGTLYKKVNTANVDWAALSSTIPRINEYFVGKHGNDANAGRTSDDAFLTFGAAIAAVSAQTPSASNRFTIVCEDAGIYTENFSVPAYVAIDAPAVKIIGNIILSDHSEFNVGDIEASTGDVIAKTSGTGNTRVTANNIIATSTATAVHNTSGVLMVSAQQVYVENGVAILDESTNPGHIHVDIEDIYITGTGSAIDKGSDTGFIVGRVAHILEQGAGIGFGTAITISTGRVDLVTGKIAAEQAYTVSAAGTLQLVCTNISGTRIQLDGAAVVDVLEANTHRWTNITSSTYEPRRFEFLNVDTSTNAITIYMPDPPSNGDAIQFQDAAANFATNNLTLDGNGSLINGNSSITLNSNNATGILIYSNTLSQWTFARTDTTAFSPSNVIYVTKNGSDVSGDGSFSNPFLTVKKGVQTAISVASAVNPTSVKILDGVYDEVNPIVVSSEHVTVQGEDKAGIIVSPTVNGQPLFVVSSGSTTTGPSLGNLTAQGRINGGTPYDTVAGGSLIQFINDGVFTLDNVDTIQGYIGVDFGSGTITTAQDILWSSGRSMLNNIGIDGKSTGRIVGIGVITKTNTIEVNLANSSTLELASFRLCGPDPAVSGTGVITSDTSRLLLNSGLVHHLDLGLQAHDTSSIRAFSTEFRNNVVDFEQVDGTAHINIQGSLSKDKQLIVNGSNVSLTYSETDTADYIVGSAIATGVPGKEFRVRDYDGRVAIGDQGTNENIASGGVGGSRSVNLIDTNGNMRIWRFTSVTGEDPALEWIKGINPANPDDFGDAPIVSITATGGTDTIVIDVSSIDYGDPLTEAGINRETLVSRAFPAGRIFRVNGTAVNNGNYTVVSATYNSGPQTISIVTNGATASAGAVGTVVFGGGAGRTDGVSTYVGNPGAAVTAGAGNVWWDMFLQESDYFVIRRRTGGGGDLVNEKVRIYPDHSEWLGASTYGDSDNHLIFTAQHVANAVNSVTLNNSITGVGPSFVAVGTDTNINLVLTPKGTGTVRVPVGYTPTAVNDLVTKSYADSLVNSSLQLYVENPTGTPTQSATGTNSVAIGDGAVARLYGAETHANGRFAADGDAQTTVVVLRTTTTNTTTPTEMFLDGAGGTARMVLPNDTTWAFRILVSARRTDTDNSSAAYQFVGVIDRNTTAASTALVGTVSKTVLAEDVGAWDCNVNADTTNGSLRILVTGVATPGYTIRWVARVELVEVTG